MFLSQLKSLSLLWTVPLCALILLCLSVLLNLNNHLAIQESKQAAREEASKKFNTWGDSRFSTLHGKSY